MQNNFCEPLYQTWMNEMKMRFELDCMLHFYSYSESVNADSLLQNQKTSSDMLPSCEHMGMG